jgi:phosphoribosylformylglycinamidine synthase
LNPNGSIDAIAGICDETGRIMGMMPHPEAYLHYTNHPWWTRKDLPEEGMGVALFRKGVDYIKKNLL